MITKNKVQELAIYQAKNGSIELSVDYKKDTIWASIDEIAFLFDINKSNVSRHIQNIFAEKELVKDSTVAKSATVRKKEGDREVERRIEYYSLDIIIAIGYRARSTKRATEFRKWATKTLKQHITQGFTINKNIIDKNRQEFLKVVEDIKLLTKDNLNVQTGDILELIKSFSYTWFSLDKYDKSSFPKTGTKKKINITSRDLYQGLAKLKKELMDRGEASEIFSQEKTRGNLEGIIGNIFQAVFGQEVYKTIEEKAAHLLYFIIKNHPFNDGNKRSGAFAFIWFLNKSKFNFKDRINPESLATLTILIAESNPKDKEKMIGIILLLLNVR